MAKDLVMQLVLENKGLTEKLEKSKRQITKFNDEMSNRTSGANASINKMTVGIDGVGTAFRSLLKKAIPAFTAIETGKFAFENLKASSQAFSDAYDRQMTAVKEMTSTFFSSLAAGDWSPMLNGWDEVHRKATEYYNYLDQEGNTRMSHAVVSSRTTAAMAEAREKASNTNNSKEVRLEGVKEFREASKELNDAVEVLSDDLFNSVSAAVANKTPYSAEELKSNFDIIRQMLEMDATKGRSEAKEKYNSKYQDFLALIDGQKVSEGAFNRYVNLQGGKYKGYRNYEDYKSVLDQQYNELISSSDGMAAIVMTALLEKIDDDRLKELGGKVAETYQLSAVIANNNRQANRLENSINGKDDKPIILTKNELTDAQKWQMDTAEMGNWVTNGVFISQSLVEQIEQELLSRNILVNIPVKVGSSPDEEEVDWGADIPQNFKIPQLETPDFTQWQDGLTGIATLMGNVAGATDSAATAWLNYAAGAATSIGQVIIAIASLVAMKEAEAAARQKNAGATMTEAIASAGKSAADIPVVGWIVALGAIAGMVTAFASIPKFENGGVVGGNSFYGDKILARVNSGEVILNKEQQASLHSQLGAKGGNVEFRISGSDLVGTLNNFNRKKGKII